MRTNRRFMRISEKMYETKSLIIIGVAEYPATIRAGLETSRTHGDKTESSREFVVRSFPLKKG